MEELRSNQNAVDMEDMNPAIQRQVQVIYDGRVNIVQQDQRHFLDNRQSSTQNFTEQRYDNSRSQVNNTTVEVPEAMDYEKPGFDQVEPNPGEVVGEKSRNSDRTAALQSHPYRQSNLIGDGSDNMERNTSQDMLSAMEDIQKQKEELMPVPGERAPMEKIAEYQYHSGEAHPAGFVKVEPVTSKVQKPSASLANVRSYQVATVDNTTGFDQISQKTELPPMTPVATSTKLEKQIRELRKFMNNETIPAETRKNETLLELRKFKQKKLDIIQNEADQGKDAAKDLPLQDQFNKLNELKKDVNALFGTSVAVLTPTKPKRPRSESLSQQPMGKKTKSTYSPTKMTDYVGSKIPSYQTMVSNTPAPLGGRPQVPIVPVKPLFSDMGNPLNEVDRVNFAN
jgi:hypothetical protein